MNAKAVNRALIVVACGVLNVGVTICQVPRQVNSYDCGVYVLHYVEVFLREWTSSGSSLMRNEGIPHFTSPNFPGEVCEKRVAIQNVIVELSGDRQEGVGEGLDVEVKPNPRALIVHKANAQVKRLPKAVKGPNKISKKWSESETSVLLKRLVGGRIRKGSEGPSHWELISGDIRTEVGSMKSADECRNRYDVLLKAYRRIKKSGKALCDMTAEERDGLSLATRLNEEWYEAIDRLQRGSEDGKCRKRAKVSRSDGKKSIASSGPNISSACPVVSGCPEVAEATPKQVVSCG